MAALQDSTISIKNCYLYGDSTSEVFTAGFACVEPKEVNINGTVFKNHKAGGIIMNLHLDSIVELYSNKILGCQTCGIYIEGEGSAPMVEANEIRNCRSTGIKVDEHVDADIRENSFHDNNDSMHILNNKSMLINNEIEKSHGIGIILENTKKEAKCAPRLQGNSI